ncbi:YciI family protein [Opitutus sp. ER46]|uniref:YciI family protein n=1 Tax=Opitutus sp. ER46 TaxID=2161864 RepID=UPI000D31757F|nr:YciI family protein [Opitutus sp. ER46]PTX91579.1 hypothetical protein DB354_17035 [Opitutus sp. ER46]
MKHYIIEITYTAPIAEIEKHLAQHRAHLQTGYDRKLLLMSGPQEPRVGGIVVARASTREELEAFCAVDPYRVAGVATYRFIEFSPVKHQPDLAWWL